MEKDVSKKNCLADRERYADLINGLLLDGKQLVKPDDLREMDSRTSLSAGTVGRNLLSGLSARARGTYRELSRDLVKKVAFGVSFVVIGIENQEEVHYLAPLRMLSYDAAEYERQARILRKQVRKRKGISSAEFLSGFGRADKLKPCITIVLYYGAEWDGSRELHEILDFTEIPSELRKYINNYPVHVFEIAGLENTDVFRTDLKQIFEFIRCARDKEKLRALVQKDPAYREMDEDAYNMAVAYTNATELIDVKKYHGKDGKVNMCKALTEMLADEREEGVKQGIEQGIEQGIRALINTCKSLGVSRDKVKEGLKKNFELTDDALEEYMRRYW